MKNLDINYHTVHKFIILFSQNKILSKTNFMKFNSPKDSVSKSLMVYSIF